jgi:site-specific DNA recombinase
MTTYGYIRVSTDKQEMSLEVQREKIQAMATVRGAELADVIVDTESGKTLDRPGAQRLLDLVRRGEVQAVIIAKLDRLTRSVADLANLTDLFNRKSVALVSVAETLDTGSAAGRMVMNIMATVAQWEREVISERTSDVLQSKRRRGERAGNIPYGFRLAEGSRLVADESEQHVISTAREYRRQGKSLRDIAAILNAANLKTRKGTPWRFQYVANVLEQSR